MSSWLWSIFYSQKLKYRVKTPSRSNIASIASFKRQVSFRFVYNFKFFYILTHLKLKLTEENQASVELYPDVLSQLDSDRASKTTTTTTLFVPNSKQKYWRVVQAAPNNHRSYTKVAAILRWFFQISQTHTHKHKTHTRVWWALNTKTNKIKRVNDVKVKKPTKS